MIPSKRLPQRADHPRTGEEPRACPVCHGLGVTCTVPPAQRLKWRRAWEDFSRGGSWRDMARCRACAAGALWIEDEGWSRFRPRCRDCGARAEWGSGDEARCSRCDLQQRRHNNAVSATMS